MGNEHYKSHKISFQHMNDEYTIMVVDLKNKCNNLIMVLDKNSVPRMESKLIINHFVSNDQTEI